MKKFLALSLISLFVNLASAQIAEWLIPPVYDDIGMADGADLIIADSAKEKTIWSFEGKRLAKTTDILSPFRENVAVATRRGTTLITGLYMTDGSVRELEGSLKIVPSYRYFSEGRLLVKNDSFYLFIDKFGNKGKMRYEEAFPYCNGYASCKSLKDSYCLLIDNKENPVRFLYNGKAFKHSEVDFVSSINDEGLGVVAINKKLFYINIQGKGISLSPVFPNEYDNDAKNQATLADELDKCISQKGDVFILSAICGKYGEVNIAFNSVRQPVSFRYNDKETFYSRKPIKEKEYVSNFGTWREGDLCGICCDDTVKILPPQFEEIKLCVDDKAFVKFNGKYGVIRIVGDFDCSLTINDGRIMPFRHKHLATTMRLTLPEFLSADKAHIEMAECKIDETKRTTNDNAVEYECVLAMPDNLSETPIDIVYKFQIIYDGIKSLAFFCKTSAWYNRSFDVKFDETSIKDGRKFFTFEIRQNENDNYDYYRKVEVINRSAANNSVVRCSKALNVYKCNVDDLVEGKNDVVVKVTEEGCPTISLQSNIEYHKPKPGEKEKVKPKNDSRRDVEPESGEEIELL